MTPPEHNDMENNHDFRGRIAALEHSRTEYAARLISLETWQRQADIANARKDVQFERIESDLKKINLTLGRIMWLIISGILVAFISFVVKGGLVIP